MPNHVYNELEVHGPAKDVAVFKRFAKGSEKEDLLEANNFIPYPKKFAKMDKEHPQNASAPKWDSPEFKNALEKYKVKYGTEKDGFNSGGYHWKCENWGTKWGFYDISIEDAAKERIKYQFNTAWSPALPVIQAMSKKFPKLRFNLYYAESGSAFQGWYECLGGQVIRNDEDEYTGDLGG